MFSVQLRGLIELFSTAAIQRTDGAEVLQDSLNELRQVSRNSKPTKTHDFLRLLREKGKLLRCYTQNFDCLEDKVGLVTDMSNDKVECVQLHGRIDSLRCDKCNSLFPFERDDKNGGSCPKCIEARKARVMKNKRPIKGGQLRLDIVLNGEGHPKAERIEDLVHHDEQGRPSFLLVLGTSLKVDGPKELLKRFAKAVHDNNGTVVYVNLTPPPSTIEHMFHFWVNMRCDQWVEDVE
ncbi:DHS-like NAD/FAD-binding domain-containing protein, partial [Diaporthe sp. PMI_573]